MERERVSVRERERVRVSWSKLIMFGRKKRSKETDAN